MIYTDITQLIGNTPLLEISESVHGVPGLTLYAKLELFNPFGSVKDRSVWGMLHDDLPDIANKGQTIVEMSSGNTAKAAQILASTRGIPFKTITNRIKVREVKEVLQVLGAEIEELPGSSDCHDPNDPNDPLVYIQREIQQHPGKRYFMSQYNNEKNITAHYETTGTEIAYDLKKVDYYFAGLGTTGSSRGPATKIRETSPVLQTIGVVAEPSDYIPGIRTKDELLEVGLLRPDFYSEIIAVASSEAVDGAVELARTSGVLGGPTSGAVFAALKQYFAHNPIPPGQNKTAVFIVCDRIESYLSYIKDRRPELFGGSKKKSWREAVAGKTVHEIGLDDMASAESSNTLVIDIRNPLAYRFGHIPGSINIPYEQLSQQFDHGNPFQVAQAIVFVCAVGDQSRDIAAFVSGSSSASSLRGGIVAWRDAGHALERSM